MTKRMLIDATHEEETRVAIIDGNKLAEYDYESQSRKPLKGSIFLAKVTRVEPSLQAAFVNFGGNRHGFLPFSEIHPDYFRIPIADREALMAEQEEMIRAQEEAEARAEAAEKAMADQEQGQNAEAEEEYDFANNDEYVVEELGGAVASFVDDEDEENKQISADHASLGIQKHEKIAPAQEDEAQEEAQEIPVQDEAESEAEDDGEEDFDSDGQEESAEDEDDAEASDGANDNAEGEGESGQDGNRNDRKSRRFRGRRRGRMPNNRGRNSTETVGGEESDDDNRFRFNLRRKYKIQEVIKRGQIMLVQVNKEERGNKGAAVGTYLSLPGRYCVLMPNSPRGGGVSRKIANYKDRARMRELMRELEVPKGMSVIVRTAGVTRTKAEIKRDLDYLMRLWDSIRELTLKSTAPALVYEEADLIKRAVRDLYTREIEEVLVSGEIGFQAAKSFMKMMMPSHAAKVKQYEDRQIPLFNRYQIEAQIIEIGQTEVRLKSGGYLVINPTEALVSIDVNSGRATKGRHIEETALKTNLEAADEVARQLKLRDLGGLVVIDFIDMEDRRNNAKVERRMKDALSNDRARVQVGRISSFGLMELSRQRLSPSLTEAQFETCKTCKGLGLVRTREAMSIVVLRAIEEEGLRSRASELIVHVSADVALYILNYKRKSLTDIESRYGLTILLRVDDEIPASEYRVEVSRPLDEREEAAPMQVRSDAKFYGASLNDSDEDESDSDDDGEEMQGNDESSDDDQRGKGRNNRRRGRRGGRNRNNRRPQGDEQGSDAVESADEPQPIIHAEQVIPEEGVKAEETAPSEQNEGEKDEKPKRKGRRPAKKKSDDDSGAQAHAEIVESAVVVSIETPDVVTAEVSPKPRAPKKVPIAEKVEKSEEAPRDYEVVNEEPKEKKRGWWNRLVE